MTKSKRILKAIGAGARTSREIAEAIGSQRRNVSVALHRLADLGLIERAGTMDARRIGRPCVRWRTRAPRSVVSRTFEADPNRRVGDGA